FCWTQDEVPTERAQLGSAAFRSPDRLLMCPRKVLECHGAPLLIQRIPYSLPQELCQVPHETTGSTVEAERKLRGVELGHIEVLAHRLVKCRQDAHELRSMLLPLPVKPVHG